MMVYKLTKMNTYIRPWRGVGWVHIKNHSFFLNFVDFKDRL